MRCKTCGYRLWNLTTPRCPECGVPFAASEFDLVPNAVEFRCPHCQQPYYGTSPRGHLEPAGFECITCHNRVHMDEMLLLPAPGVDEEQTEAYRIPWLKRGQRGLVKAWLATIGMALIHPGRLMRGLPKLGGAGAAWVFALLNILLITLVAWLPIVGFVFVISSGFGRGPPRSLVVLMLMWEAVFLAGLMFVFLVIWGLTVHGLLRLTGQAEGGLGRTYKILCFSTGANVAAAIPCLGMYLGWIWWVISAVLMIKEGQQVRARRAALAVVTLPVLCVLGFAGLVAWGMYMAATISPTFAAGSPGMPAPPGMLAMETQTVVTAVLRYADDNNGLGPRHAVELVAGNYLAGSALVSSSAMSTEQNVPVGDATLDALLFAPPDALRRITQSAIGALPQGTIAHRLGDFVFACHGVNISQPAPGLWVVIRWPDPDQNPSPNPADPISVGLADGTTSQFPQAALTWQLTQQNAIRAGQNLPPLPDPRTVTHTQPAVVPPR